MVEVDHLTKNYGRIQALEDVSFRVDKGEVVGFLGPNGAGKTTLVSQLTGVLMPDAGEITFRGNDITYMPAYRRPHLGMARSFQITSIIHDMTVLENVLLAVQAKTGHSYRFWRSADSDPNLTGPAMDALRGVGLEDQAMQIAGPLSHGEHRQLEMAMVLATRPILVLLDEPTAGLSPAESTMMASMLQKLDKNITMLIIEHDMDVAFEIADRIAVLHYGELLAEGTKEEVRANQSVQEIYLGVD